MRSIFIPYSIVDLISTPDKLERKTPYSQVYPVSRQHKFLVDIPDSNWNLQQHNFYINSKNIFYEKEVLFDKRSKLLTIEHNYKAQTNHVSLAEFPEFYTDLTKLDKEINYNIIKYENVPNKALSINSTKIIGILVYLAMIGVFSWLAFKVHCYNIIPKTQSYYEPNKAIGGWLIAIGALLLITLLTTIINIFVNNHFINGNWLVFIRYNKTDFIFNFMFILDVVFSALALVYYPLAIILFFNKRSTFPKIHSIYLCIFFVFYTLNILIKGNVNDTGISLILVLFLKTAIIIPYLLLSDRVKETFVKTLESENKKTDFYEQTQNI